MLNALRITYVLRIWMRTAPPMTTEMPHVHMMAAQQMATLEPQAPSSLVVSPCPSPPPCPCPAPFAIVTVRKTKSGCDCLYWVTFPSSPVGYTVPSLLLSKPPRVNVALFVSISNMRRHSATYLYSSAEEEAH